MAQIKQETAAPTTHASSWAVRVGRQRNKMSRQQNGQSGFISPRACVSVSLNASMPPTSGYIIRQNARRFPRRVAACVAHRSAALVKMVVAGSAGVPVPGVLVATQAYPERNYAVVTSRKMATFWSVRAWRVAVCRNVTCGIRARCPSATAGRVIETC